MGVSVSTLNIAINGDAKGLEQSLASAAAKVEHLGNRMERAGSSTALTKFSSKNAMAFQELSRGAEDFAVVLSGGGGLGRALTAASNNLSQFASRISPAAGAIVGFGVAVGTLVVPHIYEMITGTKKAQEEADELAKRLDKNLQPSLERVAHWANEARRALDLQRTIEGLGSTKEGGSFLQDQRDEFRSSSAELSRLSDQLLREQAAMEEMRAAAMRQQITDGGVSPMLTAQMDAQAKFIEGTESQIKAAQGRIAASQEKIIAAEARQRELAGQEFIAAEEERAFEEAQLMLRLAEEEAAAAKALERDPNNTSVNKDHLRRMQRDLPGPVAAARGSQEAFSMIQRTRRNAADAPEEEIAENTATTAENTESMRHTLDDLSKGAVQFVSIKV
jgi:hypothetical protein